MPCPSAGVSELVHRQLGSSSRALHPIRVVGSGGAVAAACIAARGLSLYAGTLSTIRTTAPSLQQRPCARLAALCLLATLTAAARCYACSNATLLAHHHLAPKSSSFSPIDNSNVRPHSSTLVLSRPATPSRPPHSDTSVIVIANSKKLLLNQNSNDETTKTTTTTIRKRFRTKRELTPTALNRIAEDRRRRANDKSRAADVLVSSETDSDSSSDRVNSSIVVDTEQNDSGFSDEDTRPEGTERPMPPVHDHGNASSVNDLSILVLVLSAIVLTVALGLITCVLSHYRPGAGEGAAGGGTAADPHDAARTPTTAPVSRAILKLPSFRRNYPEWSCGLCICVT